MPPFDHKILKKYGIHHQNLINLYRILLNSDLSKTKKLSTARLSGLRYSVLTDGDINGDNIRKMKWCV